MPVIEGISQTGIPCNLEEFILSLSVQLAPRSEHGLKLKNPVMVASGTFGCSARSDCRDNTATSRAKLRTRFI